MEPLSSGGEAQKLIYQSEEDQEAQPENLVRLSINSDQLKNLELDSELLIRESDFETQKKFFKQSAARPYCPACCSKPDV